MKHLIFLFIFSLSFFTNLESESHVNKFEGILGNPIENYQYCFMGGIGAYIPYNPVIVEVNGNEGDLSKIFSSQFPYGMVYVFESNPSAFQQLFQSVSKNNNVMPINHAIANHNGTATLYLDQDKHSDIENNSSLLPPKKKDLEKDQSVMVSCITLDDWCKQNQIDHIDCLRLDAGGYELQILKASPAILKKTNVITTRTFLQPFRRGTTQYESLKAFLLQNEFELISHWYKESFTGEAIFVKKHLFDSIFR